MDEKKKRGILMLKPRHFLFMTGKNFNPSENKI